MDQECLINHQDFWTKFRHGSKFINDRKDFRLPLNLAGRDGARPTGKGEIKSDPDAPYKTGSVIRHEKLGRGTVLNVEGAPNDWRLAIRFPEGIKTIMSPRKLRSKRSSPFSPPYEGGVVGTL